MKKTFFTLVFTILISLGATAQTKKDGTPDMRYKANKEVKGPYTSNSSPTYLITSPRPVYSGKTHTESHNGTYPGSTNSHHKNGTYKNPSSNNRYGIHKKKN
jgi:hypothetical protein